MIVCVFALLLIFMVKLEFIVLCLNFTVKVIVNV
jgi:hypothetical protein